MHYVWHNTDLISAKFTGILCKNSTVVSCDEHASVLSCSLSNWHQTLPPETLRGTVMKIHISAIFIISVRELCESLIGANQQLQSSWRKSLCRHPAHNNIKKYFLLGHSSSPFCDKLSAIYLSILYNAVALCTVLSVDCYWLHLPSIISSVDLFSSCELGDTLLMIFSKFYPISMIDIFDIQAHVWCSWMQPCTPLFSTFNVNLYENKNKNVIGHVICETVHGFVMLKFSLCSWAIPFTFFIQHLHGEMSNYLVFQTSHF